MRENDFCFKTSLACFILFGWAVNHASSCGLSSLVLLRIYYVFLFTEKMVFSAEQVSCHATERFAWFSILSPIQFQNLILTLTILLSIYPWFEIKKRFLLAFKFGNCIILYAN